MIDKEELLNLIPHRGKMMMLDRVLNYDLLEKSIEAQYLITDECIFFDDKIDGVPAWVGFEFIAQAVSAFIGLRERENKIPPKKGYILGVSQISVSLPILEKNSIIKIKSKELENVQPVYVFEGEIFINGQEALSGKITVMEVTEEQKQEE